MRGLERLAVPDPGGGHLSDPAVAMQIGLHMLRSFFRDQGPDVTAMADRVIGCDDRDAALSKQPIRDLQVERLLVGCSSEEEVGPLLCELPKNHCCVCSASAWISKPSRSSSPSSFWSTARS